MKQVLSSSLLVLALVTVADNSNAQGVSASEPTATPVAPAVREGATSEGALTAKAAEKERSVYLAISPLHLVFTTAEITAEFNLGRRVSVAAIGTLGSISFDAASRYAAPTIYSKERFLVWGAGAQLNYYMLGNFNTGLRAGAQIRYVNVSFSGEVSDIGPSPRTETVTGTGTGFSSGLYLGGKWTSSIGFTLNADIGLGYLYTNAFAFTESESAAAQRSGPVLLANINMGWSF